MLQRCKVMRRTLIPSFLLPFFFCAISAMRAGNQKSTLQPQSLGHPESHSIDNMVAQDSENKSVTAQEVRLSKPKCGLQFSGYVHNASSCVTIFCNFILVSRHWAFMPKRCAIPDSSGGIGQNKFTMGHLSHEDEKEPSLVQTVRGEKVIPHPQIPAVMVKLAPAFLSNDCLQAWLPVSPPQSEFNNMHVEGYKGNEPKLYIIRKTKNVYPVSKQGCEDLFPGIYNHAIHFCILHKDDQGDQEFIPPGSPIYAYYKAESGKDFHDIVGMKWRVIYKNAQYFAICFRLHNYVDWIISVVNG